MPFDVKKFGKSKFTDRTEAVNVPDLAEWFGEKEEPEIIVRGLTGSEIAAVNEAAAKNKNLAAILEAFVSSDVNEKIEAIKAEMGVDGRVPDDIARRVEQLRIGSVSPVFNDIEAAQFFEVFPIEAYMVTNAINRLTGKGKLPGESKPSGKIKKSK